MGWNGSGVFNRLFSWTADKAAAINITASRVDADTNDIVTNGLGNALTRDGQGFATTNLPMGGFRHTGVANGVARTDYAALGQIQDSGIIGATDTGAANAYVITLVPAISAYAAKQIFWFKATNANTTTSTLNVNGLGVKTIYRMVAGGITALTGGEITLNGYFGVIYDGVEFLLLNPALITTDKGGTGRTTGVPSVLAFSGGPQNLAAGATGYFGLGFAAATEANVSVPIAVTGTLKNFYVQSSAAPGGGQTYTVTFRKASADTALTCTISGAAAIQASDLTHSVAVTAGDILDFKVVTSGGAATAFFAATVELDITP